MKTLADHLSTYALYHRDRRNLVTHFVGIPMIVVAIAALLGRASVGVGGVAVSGAVIVSTLVALFYFALDLRYGLVMAAFLAASVAAGHAIAATPTGTWLGASIGLFVVGWAFQFVGHVFEGKKPAFFDDLRGLLVGPLFLVAEAAFAMGLSDALRREVERRAGPLRDRAASTSMR